MLTTVHKLISLFGLCVLIAACSDGHSKESKELLNIARESGSFEDYIKYLAALPFEFGNKNNYSDRPNRNSDEAFKFFASDAQRLISESCPFETVSFVDIPTIESSSELYIDWNIRNEIEEHKGKQFQRIFGGTVEPWQTPINSEDILEVPWKIESGDQVAPNSMPIYFRYSVVPIGANYGSYGFKVTDVKFEGSFQVGDGDPVSFRNEPTLPPETVSVIQGKRSNIDSLVRDVNYFTRKAVERYFRAALAKAVSQQCDSAAVAAIYFGLLFSFGDTYYVEDEELDAQLSDHHRSILPVLFLALEHSRFMRVKVVDWFLASNDEGFKPNLLDAALHSKTGRVLGGHHYFGKDSSQQERIRVMSVWAKRTRASLSRNLTCFGRGSWPGCP